jgi:hypothetical protein
MHRLLFVGAGLLWACATAVDPPARPDRTPLVEGLLVGGADTATIRVGWAEAEVVSPPEPATASEVDLTLATEGGPAVRRLLPHPDSAGLFFVSMPLLAGRTYRLTGTVGDHSITASTTIPAGFSVFAPAQEVVIGSGPTLAPFWWRAPGATVFAADLAVFGESQFHFTRDTVGTLQLVAIDSLRSRVLTLWAMNADVERYLYHVSAARGNLVGGLGMLGGGLAVRLPLRWRP